MGTCTLETEKEVVFLFSTEPNTHHPATLSQDNPVPPHSLVNLPTQCVVPVAWAGVQVLHAVLGGEAGGGVDTVALDAGQALGEMC